MYCQLYDLIVFGHHDARHRRLCVCQDGPGTEPDDTHPVLSARDDLPAKQKGFDLGIDDYMVKPIDLSELLMRVRALLRRANIEASRR